MAGETSDDFQRELVDLFVQEAQEWLQNIHVALDELQQGPAADRHAALIGILTDGVTNLGGSAATINLPEVEQASFAAIPFIDALKDPQKSFSVQDFLSLCKQLGQIQAALTRATGISFDAHEAAEAAGAMQATVSPAEFLEALRTIQSAHQEGAASDRSVIGAMIDQMDAQVKAGVQQVGVDVIQGYLDRMSASEDAFIQSVDASVSALSERLSACAKTPTSASGLLEASLQDVTQLRTDAQQINAVQAITFFSGLHSLLAVVVQYRVRLATERIEAITARLGVVRGLIHQWVERGRIERAAIGQVLPVNQ
jgi:chemotaxis protein histidine kinase CheA